MARELLVFGERTFKIEIPEDAKITFGPFSPPPKGGYGDSFAAGPGRAVGTLRIYRGSKDNIVACFAGVRGFRDLSLGYAEEVAVEQGATIWNSDQHGYQREEKVQSSREWVDQAELPVAKNGKKASAKKK